MLPKSPPSQWLRTCYSLSVLCEAWNRVTYRCLFESEQRKPSLALIMTRHRDMTPAPPGPAKTRPLSSPSLMSPSRLCLPVTATFLTRVRIICIIVIIISRDINNFISSLPRRENRLNTNGTQLVHQWWYYTFKNKSFLLTTTNVIVFLISLEKDPFA